jgi:tRNA pseudouridine13 synthase
VDEVAAYPLAGEGDHLFVRLEKRGWNTRDAVNALARAAGVRPADVGVAGMKDRHAITTQWASLPARQAAPPEGWSLPEGLSIREVTRHKNKLRTGHLSGNRFAIRLVEVAPNAVALARAVLERLSAVGLVNHFGPQRFGRGGTNLAEALAWLGSERRNRQDRFARKLFPSVLQAEAFNRYATRRAAESTDVLLEGEVVRLSGTGSVFVVEDPERERARLLARDILSTGPMFGPKMKAARAHAAELEAATLAELDLTAEAMLRLGKLAPGTRRDLLVYPEDAVATPTDGGIEIRFSLPAGSYATQVVRELTRGPFIDLDRPRSGEKPPERGGG